MKETMHEKFKLLVGGSQHRQVDDEEQDAFCERNQLNYDKYGHPCVYLWKDGSRTETVSYGPGDVRIKN